MTVQPAEPTKPDASAGTWRATASVLAWMIYFGSLVIAYLVAFAHNNLPCQRAAGWGLAISLAAAVIALPAALGRRTRSRSEPGGPATDLAVGGLLAAASIAVVWVAMNLTVENQPAGAWALTIPAVAAPLALLVIPDRERRRPSYPEVGDQVPVPMLEEPKAGTADTSEADRTAEEARQAEEARRAEEARKAEEARQAEEARKAEEARAVQPKAKHRSMPLLDSAWRSRLGDPAPAIALDSGFWQMTVRELAGRDAEQGGVALMARSDGILVVFGAVFPVQLQATAVYCEFPTDDVIRVRRSIDAAAAGIGLQDGDVTVTWIHTHPHMGPFLSGTDIATARTWRSLDPDFTPIVLDAHGRSLDKQIGVFDADGQQIAPMGVIEGLVNVSVTPQLISALRRTYRADGLPDPLVLIPGAGEGGRSARPASRRNYR